jgi:hypothetical protein
MDLTESLRSLRSQTLAKIKSMPLVRSLLEGVMPRDGYASYLVDVYHYAKHSPVVISLSGSRCIAEQPELGSYLSRHALEELGHEEWARQDLLRLNVDPAGRSPSLVCETMVALEYFVAGVSNPVGLLGWMHVLEALGDDLGHATAAAAPDCSTFVDRHGDADRTHVREIEEVAGRLIIRGTDKEAILRTAALTSKLYAEMVAAALPSPS